MAICTPADVRVYIGKTEAQVPDSVLTPLCEGVDAFVLSFLNRDSLTIATYDEVYHGTGSQTIVPDNRPVTSVTLLEVNGAAVAPAVGMGPGLVWDHFAVHYRDGLFPRGLNNVRIVYEAGFATLPADIKDAAVSIVAEKYARSTRVGVASKTIGQESISYRADDMTPQARRALNQYRITMVTGR